MAQIQFLAQELPYTMGTAIKKKKKKKFIQRKYQRESNENEVCVFCFVFNHQIRSLVLYFSDMLILTSEKFLEYYVWF